MLQNMVNIPHNLCSWCHCFLLEILYFVLLISTLNAVMLKQECSTDEIHKSCWFYEEYTCWEDELRHNRVMVLPQRLTHCTSGCYCKQGFVRGYPKGPCILAPHCLNERIRQFLKKLPA